MSLDDAQAEKLNQICRSLQLEPGERFSTLAAGGVACLSGCRALWRYNARLYSQRTAITIREDIDKHPWPFLRAHRE